MAINLPSVSADNPHRMITLGDLRALVTAAADMPDELVVRGQLIPFKTDDLGNPHGMSLMALSLDMAPTPPDRATRRAR